MLYAQHWASTNGHPEPAAAEELRGLYGNEKAAAIDLSLRLIRIGNLLGNTWDRILGRFGAAKIYPRP